MYELYLERAEDPPGMAADMSKCVAGTQSREQFVKQFTTSEEYCRKMLEGLYEQYLCRASDPAGMAQKKPRCEAGTTREQFIAEFKESDEYKQKPHPCPPKSGAAVIV